MGRHRRSDAGRAEPAGRSTESEDGAVPFAATRSSRPHRPREDSPSAGHQPYGPNSAYGEYWPEEPYGQAGLYGEASAPYSQYDGRPETGGERGDPRTDSLGSYEESGGRGARTGPGDGHYGPGGHAPSSSYGAAPYATAAHPARPSVGPQGARQRKKRGVPVRTGLLSVSAAVALGAVAVGTGLIPGSDLFGGGQDAGKVEAADSPSGPSTDGGAEAAERGAASASRGSDRSESPKPSPSHTSASPSASPSERASHPAKRSGTGPGRGAGSGAEAKKDTTPPRTVTKAPETQQPVATAPKPQGAAERAAAEVLSLVNQERSKAGCSPVRADGELAALAGNFSADMAARDFFDHTDPDGDTPWDRAKQAGVSGLGGENIARGQANAQSVMDSWMNSPGHRANILNCDYKTLGVGVHFGSGGPWWTQDFGF
ncbi:CAP domain-containing protein [Streptomyces tsukubensis]|uniref:SCP domain-containing protein n=1 Tax=Streptomyces tsukubensis TaxID=83656 RepID=A0A1V4A5I4_9ACTN|nr:CAP domain-containing protein [Streptomyces tsukubensis]OON76473.1 hypothetical protein B1H18_20750 [Streptomyces tsukubensis]QFR95951.1 CAP domain-containing protein [Streptomyces tsukubensis]